MFPRVTACLALLFIWPQVATADDRPNIVLIMGDDMGFSDLGCYGSEIHTPHLDRLAAGGLRFTQFYNNARCCPTCASLLTGLYPHQAGIGHMMEDRGLDGYRGDLNDRCLTIAEVLRSAGYATYMSGKWHVTKTVRPRTEAQKHNWPLQRGFDRFYGTIHGAGSFFDPNSLTRDNTLIAPDSDNYYYTDAISDNAVRYIDEHDHAKPFFLYVSYTAAHWPMHAKPADIANYRGRYDKGWDHLRDQRYRRMLELGLIDSQWQLSPNVLDWEREKDKDWQARRMEVYAAMIDCMDQGIGRIVASLEHNEYLNNTLILFLQDNGGCAEESGSQGPIQPDPSKPVTLRPMQPGELQFDMVPAVTRDGRPVRQGRGVMPGPADTYVAYGIHWANASNTPFRLYKHWVHEGGIATPLIVHWPAGIRRANEWEAQPSHVIDLMPTCVDVAGATYPKQARGKKITPLPGVSLRPTFNGQPLDRNQPLFWEHEGNRAIRDGKWKLVAQGPRGAWELYDLEADRSELNNLAGAEPERVKQMADRWEAWAAKAQVKPWPYDPKPARKER